MVKCQVTKQLEVVTTPSTLSSARQVLESMCLVPFLWILSLLWLMRWGLDLTVSFSTQSSSSAAKKMPPTTLPVAIIPVSRNIVLYVNFYNITSGYYKFLHLLFVIYISWERDRWSVLGPHQKACWQLHWSPGVLGLQCCWWRNWFWTWFSSVGASVCWLWQEIQTWFHCLSISSGVHLCCWAIQQCSLHSLSLGAHWCCSAFGQWGHLWHLQALPWHWAPHLH